MTAIPSIPKAHTDGTTSSVSCQKLASIWCYRNLRTSFSPRDHAFGGLREFPGLIFSALFNLSGLGLQLLSDSVSLRTPSPSPRGSAHHGPQRTSTSYKQNTPDKQHYFILASHGNIQAPVTSSPLLPPHSSYP